MLKILFAAAVASATLVAMPAGAKQYTNRVACSKWHNGRCVAWHDMTRAQARRAAMYRVGYRFAPTTTFTTFSALPQPVVSRYRLRPDWRYVDQNGYVYVVNPRTDRVVRVIPTI